MPVEVKAQQTTAIQGVSEGDSVYLRALRDGAMVHVDWKQAAVMGGHGFMCNSGAVSVGLKGGGSASTIDLDRPTLVISIPSGTAVLPLRMGIHFQTGAPGDGEEIELLIGVDQDKAITTDGTGTATSVYNVNTLCGKSSVCTVRNTFAATMTTDPDLDLELARKVIEYDVLSTLDEKGIIADLLYEPKNPPIINGPAAIICYAGGTAATAGGANNAGVFTDAMWLEFSDTKFEV